MLGLVLGNTDLSWGHVLGQSRLFFRLKRAYLFLYRQAHFPLRTI
jgi:hypothetical protein